MKITNTEMDNFVKVMLIHGANLIEKKNIGENSWLCIYYIIPGIIMLFYTNSIHIIVES